MVPTSTTADSLPNDISEELIIDVSIPNYIREEEIIEEEIIDIIAPQVEEPPQWSDECCIYRVPKRLREVNEKAYTPKLISIGPFHHGNKDLSGIETLKERYFLEFCHRSQTMQKDIIRIIADNEQAILYCYDGGLEFTGKDLVKIVALDSIFIIEHFIRATDPSFFLRIRPESTDPVSSPDKKKKDYHTRNKVSQPWLKGHITLDLILLENQLPFFILDKLYEEVFKNSNFEKEYSFFDLAWRYFCKYLFFQEMEKPPEGRVKHFTDLIRYIYYPSDSQLKIGGAVSYVYSATKLYETGVRFAEIKKGRFDEIKFKKWEPLGKCQCSISWLLIFLPCLKCFPCSEPMQSLLYLPSFVADNRTEEIFRNIMALEQCHYPLEAYLCNYMVLLDHLINTSEDVELLVDKGIIVNALGSHQEVANMVNKIALEIVEENSCYGDVAEKLKNHYKNGWNRNIGYLKSTYFSNLWRGTATVVGLIILGFTLWDFVRSTIK